jgi:Phage envelope protein
MNTEIIVATARASLDGSISFPEVVSQLLAAGVEYYHVDYAALRKTFYGADGGVVMTPIDFESLPPVAASFDSAALRADILDSQRNGQKYRDFTRRAMEAGVMGYFAFLRGKRVTYFGRQGDQHTEWFPGAAPTP